MNGENHDVHCVGDDLQGVDILWNIWLLILSETTEGADRETFVRMTPGRG